MVGGMFRWLVCVALTVALSNGVGTAQEAAPAAGVGTITGVVLDKASGDPVISYGFSYGHVRATNVASAPIAFAISRRCATGSKQ